VDSRAGLDDVEKMKFLTLLGLESRSLGCPARVTIPTELSRHLMYMQFLLKCHEKTQLSG
jgi:hypothetical protein